MLAQGRLDEDGSCAGGGEAGLVGGDVVNAGLRAVDFRRSR